MEEFKPSEPIKKTDEPDSPMVEEAELQTDDTEPKFDHCIYNNNVYSHGSTLCVGQRIIRCYDGRWGITTLFCKEG